MNNIWITDKIVKPLTKSYGRVYIPASWVGKWLEWSYWKSKAARRDSHSWDDKKKRGS